MQWFDDLMNNRAITQALPTALWETIVMVGISTVATVILGGAIGILLHLLRPNGLMPVRWLHFIISSVIVNITRSIPYAILMIALIGFTKLLMGTSVGPYAATVALTIGTAPFFARLVETALREIPSGTVDAAKVMGMTKNQIIFRVFIPEALPGLIAAITNTIVVLIGYSAMAGLIGAGGLGRLAYNQGYQRGETGVMIIIVILIVLIVQAVQWIGDRIVNAVDHR